jgi:ribosomal protein S20
VANSSQARKRARQNEKNRRHNGGLRSMLRTYLKKTDTAIQSGKIALQIRVLSIKIKLLGTKVD